MERILTKNKACSSYLVDKSPSAMNEAGTIFVFTAFINAGDTFEVGDGVLFDRVSYEIIEFRFKKKTLTTFYAKKL